MKLLKFGIKVFAKLFSKSGKKVIESIEINDIKWYHNNSCV